MTRASLAAVSAALLMVCAPAYARDAKDVFADYKAASGGAAWDQVRSVETNVALQTSGLKGTASSREDSLTGRFVDRFDLGVVKGANGFDGKLPWTQDGSGQVRLDQGVEAVQLAFNEAFRRSNAIWFPDRRKGKAEILPPLPASAGFEVVGVTPEGGSPFEIWFDAKTHLVNRIVEKQAMDTRTVFFSEYRPENGLLIAHASRATNGDVKYDTTTTLTSIKLNVAIEDKDFAPPPPPAPDFAIAGGAAQTTVPFQLINNHIYVDVMLNGKGPFRMLCDTGGANIITPDVAKLLGAKPEGAIQGRGVGDKSEDVAFAKLSSFQVGQASLKDPLFLVFPFTGFSDIEGVPFVGVVGYETFKRFVVTIDYANGKLTLTDPKAFAADGRFAVVPFVLQDTTPEIDGTFDGIKGRFSIDTGARNSLTLMTPFVNSNGLRSKYRNLPNAVGGWGVGGATRADIARGGRLQIGPFALDNLIVQMSTQTKGAFSVATVAGNIGGGVLKRFTVVFDYGNHKMYLAPNAQIGSRDAFDRVGFWINRDGDAFKVFDVLAQGAAQQAGLKTDDRIVAIDGKAAKDIDLPGLRLRLANDAPGTVVHFTVERAGQRQDVAVTLRDLI